MLTVLIFIIILAALILVHEFGHFIVAKKVGMRVDEFAIGFPPAIFSFKKGETKYSLNAIPLGGFVKIFGEDPDEKTLSDKDIKRSFTHRPRLAQAAVLIAGVLFNVLFAWVLISFGLMSGIPLPVGDFKSDEVKDARVIISSVLANSPAEKVGLKVGDTILFIGSEKNSLQNFVVSDVQQFISSEGGKEINILYKRGEENLTAFVKPTEGIIEDKFAIGISMEDVATVKVPFYKALWEGLKLTVYLIVATTVGLFGFIVQVFAGSADFSSISGPVGIVGLVGDATTLGFVYLLTFTAIISINLAVINLIPFPALDGGRLLFVLIEAIKGSAIKPQITNFLNTLGFVLLIVLMVMVTYHDIVKLF